MRLKTLLLSLSLGLFSMAVIAGGGQEHGHGHSHSPVDQATEAKKRTLYVFLTLSGDYIAANYTGK